MTSRKHLKRKVRERSAKTGESYATALRHLRQDAMEEAQLSTLDEAQIIAICSFCKKNNTQVKKLIAGPGVYICDECVSLCDQIIATETTPEEAAQRREESVNPPADVLLQRLPAMAATAAAVEADLHRCVERVIAAGGTFEQVAGRLDISEDEARLRFPPTK
jgi:hypothetical protein